MIFKPNAQKIWDKNIILFGSLKQFRNSQFYSLVVQKLLNSTTCITTILDLKVKFYILFYFFVEFINVGLPEDVAYVII